MINYHDLRYSTLIDTYIYRCIVPITVGSASYVMTLNVVDKILNINFTSTTYEVYIGNRKMLPYKLCRGLIRRIFEIKRIISLCGTYS